MISNQINSMFRKNIICFLIALTFFLLAAPYHRTHKIFLNSELQDSKHAKYSQVTEKSLKHTFF